MSCGASPATWSCGSRSALDDVDVQGEHGPDLDRAGGLPPVRDAGPADRAHVHAFPPAGQGQDGRVDLLVDADLLQLLARLGLAQVDDLEAERALGHPDQGSAAGRGVLHQTPHTSLIG
jgi:hypothetical protein